MFDHYKCTVLCYVKELFNITEVLGSPKAVTTIF